MTNPEHNDENAPNGWWHLPTQLDRIERLLFRVLTNQGIMMATFEQYVKDQTDHNQATSDALNDIASDIQALTDLVASLRSAEGTLTAEQQAVLDELDSKGGELADKAKALANVTPPPAPTPAPAPGPVAG